MSALNTAVRRGLIDRNPAATVELPRRTQDAARPGRAEELGRFLTRSATTGCTCSTCSWDCSGCAEGRSSRCAGSTWTSTPGLLRIEQSAVTGRGTDPWSGHRSRPRASGRSPSMTRPPDVVLAPGRQRLEVLQTPATSGSRSWCSPPRRGAWTRPTCRGTSTGWSPATGCRGSGCTTCATPPRPSVWRRGSRWSRSAVVSGTARSRSPPTSTPTSRRWWPRSPSSGSPAAVYR